MSNRINIAAIAGLMAACLLIGCKEQPKSNPEARSVDAGRIYPYLVPDSYLAYLPKTAQGLAKPLGHGIQVILVEDRDGMIRNVTAEDLAGLALTSSQAHAKALDNLGALVKARTVVMKLQSNGPRGKPFVILSGHWAAAACILLPESRTLAGKHLGTEELCVSVPRSDAMLVFARGDRALPRCDAGDD